MLQAIRGADRAHAPFYALGVALLVLLVFRLNVDMLLDLDIL